MAERLGLAAVALAAAWLAGPAAAESWPEEKCRRYAAVAEEVLGSDGVAGVGDEFRERHAAFVAGDCTGQAEVCPRSGAELAAADMLTVMAMSEGMASTFLPFACRD